eukprot:TRINITY_DN3409_c0_g1_i2.p1 TRINITY_DN3409_c0_g1~~TRINITY_DN3409_c0_g1_i2.p1  ORF type:complete len:438 (+),score=68.97 TRINITY_DN3409_c0_g1_i2:184-1497(+)
MLESYLTYVKMASQTEIGVSQESPSVHTSTGLTLALSDKASISLAAGLQSFENQGQRKNWITTNLGYNFSFSHMTSFYSTLSASQMPFWSLGFKRTLNAKTKAEQFLKYYPKRAVVDMGLQIERDLATFGGSSAYVRWVLNTLSTMKIGLSSANDSKTSWMVGASATPHSCGLSAEISKEMTSDTTLSLGGQRSFMEGADWSFTPGISFKFDANTVMKLELAMQKGGIEIVTSFRRWGHFFSVPVQWSTFSLWSAFTGFLSSVLYTFVVRRLFVKPFLVAREERELQYRRAAMAGEKIEAENLIKTSLPSIEFSRNEEEEKGGLVILHASYGNLAKRSSFVGAVSDSNPDLADVADDEEDDEEIVNVTDAIQYLVSRSALHLGRDSKSTLPGFYDPCTGFDNYLEIYYLFKGELHHVIRKDDDQIDLPLKAHRRVED